MKARLGFLMMLLVLGISKSFAQIPNPGFEQLNNDGSISNWGNVYLFSVTIDSNGVSTTDSIVFDNQFYGPTTDAHSGNYAMEMRNAFNYTTGTGIAGSVSSDTDAVYSAWGSLELVPILTFPTELSFYYKFFPVNGDTGAVEVVIYDSLGTEIGFGSANIGGLVSTYTYFNVPITYTMVGWPAYYSLNFSTSAYGFSPSFGTRFLIDDVGLNDATGIKDVSEINFEIYPNPVADLLHIESPVSMEHAIYQVYDVSGKLVQSGALSGLQNVVDTRALLSGIYFLEVKTTASFQRKLFCVNH